MSTEIWMGILSTLLALLSAAFTVVWKLLRDESKQHSEDIKLKADKDKLKEAEDRWEKMYERQERTHDKEDMKKDFLQRMDSMENNIMSQISLMMELIKKDK